MKNLAFSLVIGLSAFIATAQTVPVSGPLPVKLELGVPTVVESGAHDRVWQTLTIDETGQTNVSSFTEAATGLNFWNPASGRYEGSEERFQIAKDGSAIATNGQHQVILAADINSGGSVDLLMPDGQRLLSNPMGLSFFDSSSGKNVLIAEITNCVGQLVAPNVVLYQNAFDTIKASLRYTYTKSGFSQDVLIHENPGSPADYGLNPDTTVLEMYSEFYNPPTPTIESGLGGDQILNFSQMQVGHGVAYVLNSTLEPVNVSKTWTRITGRNFLIESVPYTAIRPLLEKVQANAGSAKKDQTARVTFSERGRMVERAFESRAKEKRMASIRPGRLERRSAAVIDYQTINTSQTNYTWKGDTTYYISGNVSLYGTSVFEGGAVIKYTNNVAITATTAVSWLASQYRPIVLTSKDDNSIGEPISGSTGAPTGPNYANPALQINTSNTQLHDLRVAYAQVGIFFYDYSVGSGNAVTHAQFVHCNQAMKVNGYGTFFQNFAARNLLINDCSTAFYGYSFSGDIEHLTLDQCGQVANDYNGGTYGTTSSLAPDQQLAGLADKRLGQRDDHNQPDRGDHWGQVSTFNNTRRAR